MTYYDRLKTSYTFGLSCPCVLSVLPLHTYIYVFPAMWGDLKAELGYYYFGMLLVRCGYRSSL